jgi:hypothetical protein
MSEKLYTTMELMKLYPIVDKNLPSKLVNEGFISPHTYPNGRGSSILFTERNVRQILEANRIIQLAKRKNLKAYLDTIL